MNTPCETNAHAAQSALRLKVNAQLAIRFQNGDLALVRLVGELIEEYGRY